MDKENEVQREMNVTFLIGNGFDRNLGLKTSYADFVKVYKKTTASTENLKHFREFISENEELWSTAEVEMGRYTAEFKKGDGAAFYECHKDFCEKLADYLKEEMLKIKHQYIMQDVESAFSNMNSIINRFPTQERNALHNIYENYKSEKIIFNFIVYNYTNTLDECIATIRKKQDVLGKHTNGLHTYFHAIGTICHVHGTVDRQMVFGVNDKTQIAKPEIFECEFGDLYEDILIKKEANKSYQEATDEQAKKLLDESQLVYIYGMSIGVTDMLWWGRISSWLDGNKLRHLIIHRHSMPPKGVHEVDYNIAVRKVKKELVGFSTLPDDRKCIIENQIHVTDENIFAGLKNIAVNQDSPEDILITMPSGIESESTPSPEHELQT